MFKSIHYYIVLPYNYPEIIESRVTTNNKHTALISAILILPLSFAPLTSFHALTRGAGYLAGFPSFRPNSENSSSPARTPMLSAITKNYLYFTSNCVSWTIFLCAMQAGSQSIETRWTVSEGVHFKDCTPA